MGAIGPNSSFNASAMQGVPATGPASGAKPTEGVELPGNVDTWNQLADKPKKPLTGDMSLIENPNNGSGSFNTVGALRATTFTPLTSSPGVLTKGAENFPPGAKLEDAVVIGQQHAGEVGLKPR